MRTLAAPDRRATAHALRRGYDISALRVLAGMKETDLRDPYYGGPEGFEQVLDMAEAAARGLVDHVRGYLSRVST
ncbi:MAG: hypothetical protein A2W21_01400 [Betaproteobacteria bacterium RBG_16_66_20]|nr:MAG: hypothetical protein A2W21_01400 [Betaproteobacteria bacterium RBG_16_66_20]